MNLHQARRLMIAGLFLIGLAGCCWMFYKFSQGKETKEIWRVYNRQELKAALDRKKPVIIDFFAQWCFACHQLDKTVFADKQVQSQLSSLAAFRVDATDIDSTAVSKILDRFNIVGLPTVVFLDKNGNEIKQARIEGVCSVEEFEKSLMIWRRQPGMPLK